MEVLHTNPVWSLTYLVLLILLVKFLIVSLGQTQSFDSYEDLPVKLQVQLTQSSNHQEKRSVQDELLNFQSSAEEKELDLKSAKSKSNTVYPPIFGSHT